MEVKSGPKIVVIGGGTGSYTVLKSLKNYSDNITALVAMVDNGGSTGELRDEYGVLPAGDVRQCLVALSNSSDTMRDLFTYRFGKGRFDGHSFGNILLAALEKITNDFGEGVMVASEVLNITGKVVPITLENTHLILTDGDDEIIGQHNVDSFRFKSAERPIVRLATKANINPAAKEAIMDADLVVIAPGSLYGSLISNLVVDGVKEAINKSSAKVVQVVNLVTKPGQTDDWKVHDYVNEIERFLGIGSVDYALYNTSKPSPTMVKQYAKKDEFPVEFTKTVSVLSKPNAKMIGLDLLTFYTDGMSSNDKLALERTLIRHDGDKLAKQLMKLAKG